MYCSKCGQKLMEGDMFCSKCGTKVAGGEPLRPAKQPSSEERKQGFETKRKPEPIRVITPMDDLDWDVQTFPEHSAGKTEDIDFDWGDTRDFRRRPTPPETALIDDEVIEEAAPETPDEFDEIFEEEPAKPEPKFEQYRGQEAPKQERTVSRAAEDLLGKKERPGEAVSEMTSINKFYTFNQKNEEFQKLLDKEYERLGTKDVPVPEPAPTPKPESTPQSTPAPKDEWPEFDPKAHINEMAKAREEFFNDEFAGETLIMDRSKFNEEAAKIEKEAAPETEPAEAVTEEAPDPDELEREIFGTDLPEGIPEDIPDAAEKSKIKTKKPMTGRETQPVEMAEAAIAAAKLEHDRAMQEEPQGDKTFDTSYLKEAQRAEDKDFSVIAPTGSEAQEEPKKKHVGGKIAIAILSVILVAMIVLLVIRIAMPDSVVAITVDNVSSSIIDWIRGIVSSITS